MCWGPSLACMADSQVLGGSVDVPVFFRSCGNSSLGAVCVTASAVAEGWGTVFIDVPTSLSGRGGSSQGAVCVAVDCRCRSSFACVAVLWALDLFGVSFVFTPCITLSNASFATRYPSSRPRFIPFSIPSSIPNFLPCFIPNFSPSSNARIQSSLRFSPSLVVEAQLQNWEMLLRSAISRKLRKSQADIDSDAVLVFPFVGNATAVSEVAVFLFKDFI
jgi:hypothetical protein